MAYYSGKIEIHKDGCYVAGQKLSECPKVNQSLFSQPFMQPGITEPGSSSLDILPANPALDVRNDTVFIPIFLAVALSLILAVLFKVKIFGLTLGEYIKPIWYFILVALAAVFWQYLVGVNLQGSALPLQISQWVWELAVLLSAYRLAKIPRFGYVNMFFLGVLYSIIIHGLKVSIRYFFYGKTLWYVLDRFLYGSLLVMAFAFVLGSIFVYFNRRRSNP